MDGTGTLVERARRGRERERSQDGKSRNTAAVLVQLCTGWESNLAKIRKNMAKFKVYPLHQLACDLNNSGGTLETLQGGGGVCPSKGSAIFQVIHTFCSPLTARNVSGTNLLRAFQSYVILFLFMTVRSFQSYT